MNSNYVLATLRKFGLNIENGLMNYKGSIQAEGVIGQIGRGRAFFVDVANGSNNNSGRTPTKAFASVEYGYTKLTANRHDTLFYIAGASEDTLTETLTWAKNYTHLIGICAPTGIAQRARLMHTNGMVAMMDITASGCVFKDIYLFQGGSSALDLYNVKVSGGRNYFENVHFAGVGHATPGDEAGASSLYLYGAEENTFVNCTVGLDTVVRTGANSALHLALYAKRNVFRNCLFLANGDADAPFFVKVDTAGCDRSLILDNCLMINAIKSGSTVMNAALDVSIACGGLVILRNCIIVGTTYVAEDDNANVFSDGIVAAATTQLGLVVTN